MRKLLSIISDTLLSATCASTPCFPGKWRLVRSLSRHASSRWVKSRKAFRNGSIYELDLLDAVPRAIFFRTYDPHEASLLTGEVPEGAVAIDVGANVGYYTLLLSRLCGPNGRVYAFEPAQHSADALRHNIELNRLSNIVLESVALGECEGEAKVVCLSPQERHLARLVTTTSPLQTRETVSVTTLDAYVERQRLTRLDLVKVNVEGGELAILTGARATLTLFRPVVIVGLGTDCSPANASVDIFRLLSELGYSMSYLTWRGINELKQPPLGYVRVVARPS